MRSLQITSNHQCPNVSHEFICKFVFKGSPLSLFMLVNSATFRRSDVSSDQMLVSESDMLVSDTCATHVSVPAGS